MLHQNLFNGLVIYRATKMAINLKTSKYVHNMSLSGEYSWSNRLIWYGYQHFRSARI